MTSRCDPKTLARRVLRRHEQELPNTDFGPEYELLKVTQARAAPALAHAYLDAEAERDQRPKFWPGDHVRLDCPDKAEHGSTGTVDAVREYGGPKMYARWEYKLRDVRWADGGAAPPFSVRESWLARDAGSG